MIPLLVASTGSYGVYLLYTAVVFDWNGIAPAPAARAGRRPTHRAQQWLAQAGLDDVPVREFVAVMVGIFMIAGAFTFVLLGSPAPSLAVAVFAATAPLASYRARRQNRRRLAAEAWPRMIEEIALLTGSLGRSIPQALFEVGGRGPEELRPAFAAAHREWMVSTDFGASVAVLKIHLADATADATCETLLVAHEVGGNDVGRRLGALVEDRIADVQGRKDAAAKLAGVRFARRFVLIVPIGMALVGLSIGDGRAAFSRPAGQVAALLAIAMIAGCWAWSGRVMRLPEERRVFL